MTSATEIFSEIGNTLVSAILTLPPSSGVGLTLENSYENGEGTWPWGFWTALASDEGVSEEHRRRKNQHDEHDSRQDLERAKTHQLGRCTAPFQECGRKQTYRSGSSWRGRPWAHGPSSRSTVDACVSDPRARVNCSLTKNVESSLKSPSGKTSRNSVPFTESAVACSECGTPGGKYHRSPGPCDRWG